MSIDQKTTLAVTTAEGVDAVVDAASIQPAAKATTTDGITVYFDPQVESKPHTTLSVVFDDIIEDTARTMTWDVENVPDDAWRIVQVILFDGTKLVFSHPREAMHYLAAMEPLRSPKEQNAGVHNIADYKPKEVIL